MPTSAGTKEAASKRGGKSRRRGQGRPAGSVNGAGAQDLIAATRALLARNPTIKLTRLEISRAAGVDPGLVRYYFKNLDGLLIAVLKEMLEESFSEVAALADEGGDPADQLRRRIETFIRFRGRNPYFDKLFTEYILHGETSWGAETLEVITRSGLDEFRTLVADGRASGIFRSDFDERFLYMIFVASWDFFFRSATPLFPLLFGKEGRQEELVEPYAAFITNLILRGIEKK